MPNSKTIKGTVIRVFCGSPATNNTVIRAAAPKVTKKRPRGLSLDIQPLGFLQRIHVDTPTAKNKILIGPICISGMVKDRI